MAKADIWMPLYIGDYLADTTRLTTEQHGAYFLLIIDYWRNGPPPNDDEILQNITKMSAKDWARIRTAVMKFFILENGQWTHSRIERELSEAAASKHKSEEKAKKAAEARWGKAHLEHDLFNASSNAQSNAPSTAQAMHEQCPLPSPSPLNSKTKSKAESALATRLPADWMPDESQIAFCKSERPDLQAMAVADRFRDHWISTPGLKGRKLDWSATWRNWVRNERPAQNTRASPSRPEKFDPTAFVNRPRTTKNERTIELDSTGEPIFEMVRSA